MRKRLDPIHGSLDLTETAVVGEIAGVDEQVTVWDVAVGPLVGVGVGDADDADGTVVRWGVGVTGRAAEAGEEEVDWVEEGG